MGVGCFPAISPQKCITSFSSNNITFEFVMICNSQKLVLQSTHVTSAAAEAASSMLLSC